MESQSKYVKQVNSTSNYYIALSFVFDILSIFLSVDLIINWHTSYQIDQILGQFIGSLFDFFLPVAWFLAFPTALVGIFFASKSHSEKNQKKASMGIVLGVVGVLINIIWWCLLIVSMLVFPFD